MAKTIFRTNQGNGFLAGTFQPGYHGDGFGSIKQITVDGDTVNVSSKNNFPIRFLAIDTPESKLASPETGNFIATDSDIFQRMLADPFSNEFDPIDGMDAALKTYIEDRKSPDAATVHNAYAKDAEDALETFLLSDQNDLGNEQYFLAFAYDALDFFGRLLAYVHPDQADTPRDERRENYNLRMLRSGLAAPYFIFPNVDPFRSRGSPLEAAAMAQDPQNILAQAPSLRIARQAVTQAREQELGIFSTDNPLQFQAFEFRFLARRSLPSRWVIDLSKNDRCLLPPQRYIEVENLEDRLFVPSEFVPLFDAAGWECEGSLFA
ncbi:MAG: thermonuclease family protein [Pseudomonadota bacterium]